MRINRESQGSPAHDRLEESFRPGSNGASTARQYDMVKKSATEIDIAKLANARAKGKRPWFFDNREAEKVMAMTLAVASELAVTRERLDTVERLLEAHGMLKRDKIDAFTPEPAAAKERDDWRQAYIARVLRIVNQELEAVGQERARAETKTKPQG
jgi:hypothetical protein